MNRHERIPRRSIARRSGITPIDKVDGLKVAASQEICPRLKDIKVDLRLTYSYNAKLIRIVGGRCRLRLIRGQKEVAVQKYSGRANWFQEVSWLTTILDPVPGPSVRTIVPVALPSIKNPDDFVQLVIDHGHLRLGSVREEGRF